MRSGNAAGLIAESTLPLYNLTTIASLLRENRG